MTNSPENKGPIERTVETVRRAPEAVREVGQRAIDGGREILASRGIVKQIGSMFGAMAAWPAWKKMPEAGRNLVAKNPVGGLSALADGIGKSITDFLKGPAKIAVATAATAASMVMLPVDMGIKAGKTAKDGITRLASSMIKEKGETSTSDSKRTELPPSPSEMAYQSAHSEKTPT